MKITYIHQYFKTPEEGGAIRSYHVASAIVEAGHKVNLITSHNEREYCIKQINGITVHYIPIPYSNSMDFIARIWSFIQFAHQAYTIAKNIPSDLVYATSTPLSVGWTALKLKRKQNTPFIFEVRDLWPEAPKQLGAIKNKALLNLLEKFERNIYQKADKIIALSPGIEAGVKEKVDAKKIKMVPNFSDNTVPSKEVNSQSSNQPFTITYTGALGYANDIDFILWMISEIDLHLNGKVSFRIIGEGKFAEQIKQACEKSSNSTFIGFESKNKIYELLSTSDIALTTFLDYPILETNSPNKFFDGLATANISLINFGGWIEDTINTNDCGYRIDRSNFTEVIIDLLNEPNRVSEMKSNAKQLALNQFDKNTCCNQILKIIES